MAKVSEVLRDAFEHHYDPEAPAFMPSTVHRFMCYAVEGCRQFTLSDRRAATGAIVDAMCDQIKECCSPEMSVMFRGGPSTFPLSWVLSACDRPYEPDDLRAWHLALIERLEAEGN